MCGIVGAVAQRNVGSILIEGLRRLEYRGYDSAGVAILNEGELTRFRALGKVQELADRLPEDQPGHTGIAHTRWATHGAPSEINAHPHVSSRIAVVHNGIIENHKPLREELIARGYEFASETDTEVVAHLIDSLYDGDLQAAVSAAVERLEGAYALAILAQDQPHTLVACRRGSPLVLGVGFEENFVASDVAALLPVTSRFVYLEEGDLVVIEGKGYQVFDKGQYRHYMLKEIHEQSTAIADCLEGRVTDSDVLDAIFGPGSDAVFEQTQNVQIVACGTSYHAGMVAKYWLEELVGIPCQVEVASEFRYRRVAVPADSLFVTLSQSGETADTLAALRDIQGKGYCGSLSICNVPESSLVRESDLVLMTRAGPEIGVASTKAFTTQLVALMLMVLTLGKKKGMSAERVGAIVEELNELPRRVEKLMQLDASIEALAEDFIDKHDALFLGRGEHYPIAMEGALKLKEISYIHAEAYPAGELKHGPLALVDADMPIVVVMPNDDMLEKLHANMEEVKARGGQLYVFAHDGVEIAESFGDKVIAMPCSADKTTPILSTIPLQLLSYHVAVQRGTDVDQPRNLAKSVTVE